VARWATLAACPLSTGCRTWRSRWRPGRRHAVKATFTHLGTVKVAFSTAPLLRRAAESQPPAMAPTTRNGSLPLATDAGSGASGASWDRSSSQAKNRTKARRLFVA
jgi:hypothetical protein